MKYQKGASGAVEIISFTRAERRSGDGDSWDAERSSGIAAVDDEIDRVFDGMAASTGEGEPRILEITVGHEVTSGYLAAAATAAADQRPTTRPPAPIAVNLAPAPVRSDPTPKAPAPEIKAALTAAPPPRAAEPAHVAPPPPPDPPVVAPTPATTADKPALLSGRVLGNEDD
jgi:hypothetical protein